MREPVITPSGITYDKKDIIEHLQVIDFGIILKLLSIDLSILNLLFFSKKSSIDSGFGNISFVGCWQNENMLIVCNQNFYVKKNSTLEIVDI